MTFAVTTNRNATSRKEDKVIKMKDTVMRTKHNILVRISLCLGLAVALAFASGCATTPGTGGQMKPMSAAEHQAM